jgi:hypothetical protein
MKKLIALISSMFLALIFSGPVIAQEQIVELKFRQLSEANSDTLQILQSIVTVRDISEQYSTGGLYLLTHNGDQEKLFKEENQQLIKHPWLEQTWRFCSIFSSTTNNGIIMGRNWDNQNVGSIIVSYYNPPNGYASISFSRAIDMGFPLNVRVDEMAQTPYGNRLLLAPFYAYDGMNEHGLCASVTGINTIEVKPEEGKESVFIGFLVRKLLDQTKTVDEAVNLIEKYVPFDLNQNLLSCHFFIADELGASVILEYHDDMWKKIYPEKKWQVMTNKIIYDAPDTTLRNNCWRYKSISTSLDKTNGQIDWQDGLQILRDVAQGGTTWSVIYSPTLKDLYFSVYQSWDKIYHLQDF